MQDKLKMLVDWSMIESGAINQIMNLINLEELKKLAIMPDVHAGYDMPIGGVALVDGKISPSFVGYDIGCGMCMIDTGIAYEDFPQSKEEREKIAQKIYESIPVGFNVRDKGLEYQEFRSASGDHELDQKVAEKLYQSLGTLGGGNHFIEIGVSKKTNNICITIHSGSRKVGYMIAEYYMKKGRLLEIDSELGQAYLQDMNFALQYALDNRLTMIKNILENVLGIQYDKVKHTLINENHNHAEITDEGILHRKGATQAKLDQLGVIPANMRDGVYVTRGLGNSEYLESASHGAGRKLSRRKAKDVIAIEEFKKVMEENGVVARVEKSTLDEAPQAYKDINEVIAAQDGVTVEVIDHIRPLINIKG